MTLEIGGRRYSILADIFKAKTGLNIYQLMDINDKTHDYMSKELLSVHLSHLVKCGWLRFEKQVVCTCCLRPMTMYNATEKGLMELNDAEEYAKN